MALQQHLGNRRGGSEVAVDLKDRRLPAGWVSNRLIFVLCCISIESDSHALSPSPRRAQKPIAQARLQPVYAPPLAKRRSSETRAACASSGVPRGVI